MLNDRHAVQIASVHISRLAGITDHSGPSGGARGALTGDEVAKDRVRSRL